MIWIGELTISVRLLFIGHGLEKQYLIDEKGRLDVIKLDEFKQKVEKPDFVINYLK